MTDDRWDTDDLSLKEDTTGWRQRLERSLQLVHISTLDFCVLWMLEINDRCRFPIISEKR